MYVPLCWELNLIFLGLIHSENTDIIQVTFNPPKSKLDLDNTEKSVVSDRGGADEYEYRCFPGQFTALIFFRNQDYLRDCGKIYLIIRGRGETNVYCSEGSQAVPTVSSGTS